jgi:hypothetical protein
MPQLKPRKIIAARHSRMMTAEAAYHFLRCPMKSIRVSPR